MRLFRGSSENVVSVVTFNAATKKVGNIEPHSNWAEQLLIDHDKARYRQTNSLDNAGQRGSEEALAARHGQGRTRLLHRHPIRSQ